MNIVGIGKEAFYGVVNDILSNNYDNFQLPGELELCETYKISRTTIREVLSHLSAKGIIKKQSKRKAEIQPIEMWDWFDTDILSIIKQHIDKKEILTHIFFLRLTFEPRVCALAALNCNIQDLYKMHKTCCAMQKGLEDNNIQLFKEEDINLHNIIFSSVKNPFINKLKNFLLNTSIMSIEHTVHSSKSDLERSLVLHKSLVEYIRLQDFKKSQEIMLYLLKDSVNKVFENDIPSYFNIFF